MKPGWLILAALAIGTLLGWFGADHSANIRYIRSLAERHEAVARYWDTQTNIIITKNTLERDKRNANH